ncbi:GrpB domain, predicted nucleotidyltransferase, UPF0157 family [Marininema mesophilum]|uniref:GrpB domain, predicted nucleotidyltransferase, UPF0157 family n=1 Tax=Marininema mesophilum TaxID=1048340 RepID=A0A1H2YJ12_9BACL|nr:GrpB family protein [Marininema mesophilum]SDX05222.1 GrpB domain, predicted nucleotidyltransferase, UPF0157 family [Marininema mesophilum]
MRRVRVVDYDPQWKEGFQEEREQLREAFGPEWVEGHHIGSTSVPGLAAKPILDFLIEVREIERVDSLAGNLKAIGYQGWGEYGIPGRRYFNKGEDERTHHVHVFAQGHPDVHRHLVFRDYLIQHPEVARIYGELKKESAQRFPTDIKSYMDSKDGFIKEIEAKALEWGRISGKGYRKIWNL